jgi:mxaA protein
MIKLISKLVALKLVAIKLVTIKLGATALLTGLLSTSFILHAAEEAATASIIALTNPAQTFGVQIGDKLSRKVVLEVPAPLKIADTAFPKKGSKNNGVELVEVGIAAEQQKTLTRYTVNLTYQTFANPGKPQVMYLPVEKFSLSGGAKPEVLEIPTWSFWFSPIVAGNITTAEKNIQPEAMPPLLDISGHKTRLAAFSTLLAVSLLALLYLNADGNWLPFMGGAFARAHRQLKRLAKSKGTKTSVEEKQALVYIHQAFNQHLGANMFARDIEPFIAKRSSFKKMKAEIAQFFDQSNQALYAIEPRDSQKTIMDLVRLSKQLRDCERGV